MRVAIYGVVHDHVEIVFGLCKQLTGYGFLVSKLKKIKTKFLRCTGYLNSIKKNPIKQDLLQILVLVRQQNFLNC